MCLRAIEDHDAAYIEKEKEELKRRIEEMVAGIKSTQESLDKARSIKQRVNSNIQSNNKKISEAKLQQQNKQNIL